MKSVVYLGIAVGLMACAAPAEEKPSADVQAPVEKKKVESIIVQTQTVKPGAFAHYFSVDGVVEADNEALVAAEGQGGRVKNILVKEGQYVQAGTLMIELNSSLQSSQLKQAQSRLTLAKAMYEKVEKLWKENNIGSEVQFLEAEANYLAAQSGVEAAQAQFDMTQIKAPISGVVDQINVKIGSMASAMQPVAHIVNLNRLNIVADVSEKYSKDIKKGDAVQVEFPDLQLSTEGKIARVGQVINPQNRSFEIEIPVKGAKSYAVKPNALAKLRVRDFYSENALVVPSNAVQQDPEGNFVFLAVKKESGMEAEKRYVQVARTNDNNQSMIVSGLKAGEMVVVKGYNLLTKGSALRLAQQ